MIRVGHGMDVHKLTEGRKLILCGVEIPYEKGLLGHSDADVAAHALMDALLGAVALGDIGMHFPDSDAEFQDADSMGLLERVVVMIEDIGYTLGNADITIVAQAPRLAPYVEQMRENISAVCGVDVSDVNVKATTTEGLGFEGQGLGISAHAVAIVYKNEELPPSEV
ncbi:MAG TPA: 2-C-methyl-D-erythritol 2,4-cyclodiphosphate synthase [Candidatus Aphodoplasma excrementigallinarum]|uniref:2-C-methyl-D-erythritol 2,4-cyclodiphosphate synthase n=1 Tax=Candidatus Aphodoplasma excrementigallinarum TaxID=2840673 RepID=A0A9D1NF41_9FIRM|nr:2-C-methyl-D-erythritol 2,4-cyclodiphosphate synthase [Candidatus Aphodoplasma excrementigallinarum]